MMARWLGPIYEWAKSTLRKRLLIGVGLLTLSLFFTIFGSLVAIQAGSQDLADSDVSEIIVRTFKTEETANWVSQSYAGRILVEDNTVSAGFFSLESNDYYVDAPQLVIPTRPDYSNLIEAPLTAQLGTVLFQGHKETYYNLDMSYFAPYSIRADGAKIKPNGDIILACHTDYRGQRRLTSLGWGICLDTGGFALFDHEQIDLAMDW
jgi:hypothetical protein